MATAPSANDLTRQQLDELDDLLQRMLNLPLTGTEPPPAPAGPTWRYDAPATPPAPVPHLVAPPEPPRAPVAPPVVRPEPITAPVPLMPPPEPATPIIERKPTPRPAPKPVAPPAPAAPPVVYEPQPPLALPLWPLAGLNWVFDRVAGLLGPPGWLLRSGFGKNVLGLAGIGLIVYTAAHLATDAGWVTLPFPVPWPR